MRQLVFKIGVFSLLFLTILFGVLDHYLYEQTRFKATVTELNGFSENEVDVFYCGSSKVFTSMNPDIIDSELNIRSFNLGTSAQNLETTAFLIEEILDEYAPKLVVLDVSPGSVYHLNAPAVIPYQLEVFDNLSFSKNKYDYFSQGNNWKEIPSLLSATVRNHGDWENKLFNHKKEVKKYQKNFTRGYSNSKNSFANPNGNYGDYKFEYKEFNTYTFQYLQERQNLPEQNKEVLLKIHRLLEDNGVKLLLVTIPYLAWYKDKNADYVTHVSGIKQLSDSLNVHYLDFNRHHDELNLKFDDFKDVAHLNSFGAEKVSLFLTKYLDETDFGFEEDFFIKRATGTHTRKSFLDDIQFLYEESSFYQIKDSLRVERVYLFDEDKTKRKVILEFTSNKQINQKDFLFQFHGKPTKRNLKYLNDKTKQDDRDRDIFYIRPEYIEEGTKKYFVLEMPHSKIGEYESILLFFQNAKTKEVTRPPFNLGPIKL